MPEEIKRETLPYDPLYTEIYNEEIKYLTIPIHIGDTPIDVLVDSGPSAGVHHSSYDSHTHAAHEIYYIKHGSLSLICNGKYIDLREGDLFVIRAHTPHHITGCSHDIARFNMRFLVNSNTADDSILSPYLLRTTIAEERVEIMSSISHIRQILSKEMGRAELYRLKSHYGILFSYALAFFNSEEYTDEPGHYSKLTIYSRIEGYFAIHCNEAITLESLAEYLNYSKAQTNRILHEYCGKSFSQLLREARLNVAKRYLAESTLTISEIAAKCGYDTRQGFEMMFIKYIGVTPHAFREKNSVVRQTFTQ